ncbi:uncharacterized protein LOC114357165 [Ostrinia furnacalis]|uniref:uncharacterized protein LOC114357165 n=1 Tax=Ostrinia furnacalis TaxID=93504 RepID=UPI001039DFBD|nr:uncharacterized protein LOC114357165 [Ostrinia furnacalis]
MNELLQEHGCSNVFSIPEGLRELMCDISREVLREQPQKIFDFIANYLSVLLITREHGILSLRILEDLCDCKPSVTEHLMQLGMERAQAEMLSQVIKEEVEGFEPIEGREKVKEMQIMKKILQRTVLDEDMAAKVCQISRNAYRDYWYRKKLLEKSMKVQPDEPWEIAAQHTLELYKKTKPSFTELTRATEKIQAAYRGYHIRKNLLTHLKPKKKKMGPKVELLGPPIDVAASREIDLGPMIDIKVQEDDVNTMFDEYAGEKLGLGYDPMKTITHVDGEDFLPEQVGSRASRAMSQFAGLPSTKSLTGAELTKSRMSRVEDVAESRQSWVPSQFDATSRQSRMQSQISESGRVSRLPSQMPVSATDLEASLHKISFAERPPEVIPDFEPEDEAEPGLAEVQEIQEVQEEPGIEPAEAVEGEPAQEVPEDIPDDRTEGDGESAPTASVPSSAPDTADNTDVEDAGADSTGEEEGD